jgi:hypothetical protein
VPHLEHIAEQHQSVDPRDRVEQCRPLRSQTQHVDAAERAQVQV